MGIRIEQINLESFSKIFPIKADIEDMFEDFEQGLISGELGPTIVGDEGAIEVERVEKEIKVKAKVATAESLGVVKVGENIILSEDGTISTDVNKAYVDEKFSGIDGSIGDVIVEIENTFTEKLESYKQECTKNIESLKEQISELEKQYSSKLEELEERVTSNYEEIQDLKDQISEILDNQASLSDLIISLNKRIEELEQTVGEEMLQIKKYQNFTYGELVLAGTGTISKVNLPESMYTNGDYTVHLTPSSFADGGLGEFWIVEKQPDFFKVKNTGSKRSIKCAFLTHGKESGDPEFNLGEYPFQSGTDTFAGSTGKLVTLEHEYPDTKYKVSITPAEATDGDLGEYWIGEKTNTSFKVFNSGRETTAKFDYFVSHEGTPMMKAYEPRIIYQGENSFKGNEDSTSVELVEPITSNFYSVLVTPSENPGGSLGEYWVEQKTTSGFVVRNTGTAKVKFDYIVIGE